MMINCAQSFRKLIKGSESTWHSTEGWDCWRKKKKKERLWLITHALVFSVVRGIMSKAGVNPQAQYTKNKVETRR